MPAGVQQQITLLTEGYGGYNNALQFSQLPREQSPSMQNAWMPKIGAIGKRPGTVPLTTSALGAVIKYLTSYKSSPSSTSNEEIYAASGTTLYKFNGTNTLTALTMTNALATSDIYTIGFTNALLTTIMVIGDGASLKKCDGSAVSNITPAADDPSPAPANVLADVNTKGCKYVWEYAGHVFISPGTNEVFYTKRYEFDYVPETQYFFLVNDNDYVNGCGVAFDEVCLIPMRRGWSIVTGENFDNFDASKFLNTTKGVIAPRSIDKITYPDGTQTIPFLSDDEMHEVYTGLIDGGGRQYATRSLMRDKIDFSAIGLTEAEKKAAVGFFYADKSLYLLTFTKSGSYYTYAYDTRNREWYPNWTGFNANTYVSLGSITYFGGTTGHLHKFDTELYSDWTNSTQTTGTPVYFKRYSPLMSFEFSGYSSYWDYYLVEARQYLIPSSLDLQIVFGNEFVTTANDSIWKLNAAVYGVSKYGQARYANIYFTDVVNAPSRLVFKKKSKYTQVLWSNNRDEPLEIYGEKWMGRVSGQ